MNPYLLGGKTTHHYAKQQNLLENIALLKDLYYIFAKIQQYWTVDKP